jgi:parallel beta-helix repeat protein
MITLKKNSIIIAAGLLLFLITGLTPYQQEQLHHFTAYAGEGGACIDHDQSENAIIITCNASFSEVANTINDPAVLEQLGDGGEYLLKASLQVDDGATLSIGPNDITWLKKTGTNGITVYGKIQIVGVKITSWGTEANSPISQTITGSIPRAFLNLRESEGGFVHDSEIAYLGYQEFGRRGFDLFGDGPSHDMEIRGSKFHDMWFAFYSRAAYNITVDGNEYYNNIKYALDPHSGTHDMAITNNWLHHNPIGAICSDRCSNILIEGNRAEHNSKAGIFFSRNMHDSIARNNYIYNTTTGIIVSESPDNEIYSNTIEEATSAGIRLSNPPNPDDGYTEGNHVYNNTISNSEDGIREIRSDGNILEDNKFFNIESDE